MEMDINFTLMELKIVNYVIVPVDIFLI